MVGFPEWLLPTVSEIRAKFSLLKPPDVETSGIIPYTWHSRRRNLTPEQKGRIFARMAESDSKKEF